MDKNVIAAMARWPEVPDVYGWLSLTERGEWRLHPLGDAHKPAAGPHASSAAGESITSPPILNFINRNYAGDDQGRWFFQNGPQKVFVRLDAAPFILHSTITKDGQPGLRTHNGLDVVAVKEWWLDDSGRAYAISEHGPGLIAGRDLETVLHTLLDAHDSPLLDLLARHPHPPKDINVKWTQDGSWVPLKFCAVADITDALGFQRHPKG